ncbi:MAG TPA: hypothetical protein VF773_09720 [Verrucomicrobiae bacterium]
MKTVLKDVKTGLLFRNMDEWTSNLEEAAAFRDTLTALKFCQRNNLDGAAIVHVFANGQVQRVVGFYRRAARPLPMSTPEPLLDRPQTLTDKEESLS